MIIIAGTGSPKVEKYISNDEVAVNLHYLPFLFSSLNDNNLAMNAQGLMAATSMKLDG